MFVQDAAAATFGAKLAKGSSLETTGSSAVVDDTPLTDSGRTTTSAAADDASGITEQKPKAATPRQMPTVRTRLDPTLLTDIVYRTGMKTTAGADNAVTLQINFSFIGLPACARTRLFARSKPITVQGIFNR